MRTYLSSVSVMAGKLLPLRSAGFVIHYIFHFAKEKRKQHVLLLKLNLAKGASFENPHFYSN